MTDNPAAGAGVADPGAAGAGAAGAAAGAGAVDWKNGFEPDIANHPSLSNFKNSGDLAKSWVNAQKLIGADKIPVPGENATPEEWGLVYDRLGRPGNSEGYNLPEVKMPDGFPEADPQLIGGFKSQCHELGILPGQASKLYEWFQGTQANQYTGMMAANQEGQVNAETALKNEWGQAYDSNLATAQSVLKQFGDENITGMLESSGLGNDPNLIKFLANIGKNFGEDGLQGKPTNFVKSPDEAKGEINSILADKQGAYFNKDNPEHKMMVEKMADLHKMAYPESMAG
jgi:hypothetical protein